MYLTLWNMPSQCWAHWHQANPAIPAVLVHLGGQWLVFGAHDKALAAFLEQARNSQAQEESELRRSRKIWKQGLECSGGDFRSSQ